MFFDWKRIPIGVGMLFLANCGTQALAPVKASTANDTLAFGLPSFFRLPPPPPPLPVVPPPVSSGGTTPASSSNVLVNTASALAGVNGPFSNELNSILQAAGTGNLCIPNGLLISPNTNGIGLDWGSTNNCISLSGSFFQNLGTNGRACVSCHFPTDNWSVNPVVVQARFNATQGNDPIFSTNDGSVCPNADVSSLSAKQTAYALLLNKGLIRIQLGLATYSQFSVSGATGIYCNQINFYSPQLSLYRRPLPATNLPFISTVMWDGRETLSSTDLTSDLDHQATDATLGHAAATNPPTAAQLASIIGFETTLFSAQNSTTTGMLLAPLGQAASQILSTTNFSLNENTNPTNNNAFTLFDSFAASPSSAAQSIYRGEQLFNSFSFNIPGVSTSGTCTTCHNTPNIGTNSSSPSQFFNTGVASAANRTSDLPLYTLVANGTGETIQVSDPGRAMISGSWNDIGAFKVPGLRGMSSRPPYFHNGSAATLGAVVSFYDNQYSIGLSADQQTDLTNFLSAL